MGRLGPIVCLALAAARAGATCPAPATWTVSTTVTGIAVDACGCVFSAGGGHLEKYSQAGGLLWRLRTQSVDLDGFGGLVGVVATAGGDVAAAGTVDRPDGTPVGYLRRYTTAGAPVWSVSWTGCLIAAAAPTPDGGLVVAGLEPRGGYAWVAKLSAGGSALWTRTSDGSDGDGIDAAGFSAVAVDAGGNIVTAGFVYADGRNANMLVEKYGASGSFLWRRVFDSGPPRYEQALGVAVDAAGNVYVTGESGRGLTPPGAEAVLLSWDAAGAPRWSRTFSGAGAEDDEARGLTINACGAVSVAGMEHDGGTSSVWRVRSFTSSGSQFCGLTELDLPSATTYGAYALAWDPAGGLIAAGGADPFVPVTAGPGVLRRYALQDCPAIAPATVSITAARSPGSPVNLLPVAYRLVVTNLGSMTLSGLTVTATLPPAATDIVGDAPPGFVMAGPAPLASGSWYAFSGGTALVPGASFTFTLTGRAGWACAPVPLSLSARVDASSDCAPVSAATTLVGTSAGPPAAGLSAALTHVPAAPAGGDPVTYRLVVTNTGSATQSALTVVATLPPVVAAPATDGPPGFPAATIGPAGSGATRYVWSAAGLTLGPGQVLTFTVTGLAGVTCGPTPVTATAWATGVGPCSSVTTFPAVTSWIPASPTAALAVTNLLVPPLSLPGSVLVYRVVVANAGTATLTGLTLIDTLPFPARIVSSDQPTPFGPPAVIGAGGGASSFTWSDAGVAIPPGVSFTFTLTGVTGRVCTPTTVRAAAVAASGSICTTVAAAAVSGLWIANPAPELLTISATSSPPVPQSIGRVTYRIVVANSGTTTLTGLTLTQTAPPVLVAPVVDQPAGYPALPPAFVPEGVWLGWTGAGPVPPGTVLTFTVTGQVAETCASTMAVSALAAAAAGDCGTVATAIGGPAFAIFPPALSVAASVDIVESGPPGAVDLWRIVVTNLDAATVTSLTVTDTVPDAIAGLATGQPAPFPAATGTPVAGGLRLEWTAAGLTLPTGGTYTFTVTGVTASTCDAVTVEHRAHAIASSVCLTAHVVCGPAAFGAGAAVPAMTLNHDWVNLDTGVAAPPPRNGRRARWTLRLVNAGSAEGLAVELVDTLPTRVARILGAAAPPGWTLDLTHANADGEVVAVATGAAVAAGGAVTMTIDLGIDGPSLESFAVDARGRASWTRSCDGARLHSDERRAGFRVDPLEPGRVRVVGGPRGWVNPGRGEDATIQVRPTAPGRVTILIHDERGVLVRDLSREVAVDRTDVIRWDGRDAAGRPVPPGLYPVLVDGPGVRARETLPVVR